MRLHEYQAKRLLASAGIPVPRGQAALTAAEAAAAYTALARQCGASAGFTCHVKAQLHAGGRGKAGGVLVARSAQEASAHAAGLLGRRLATHQTGPEGLPVAAVLLEERIEIAKEWYLALTVDRFAAQLVVLASRRGGVDIEEVAAKEPAMIVREPLEALEGPTPQALARIAQALGCASTQAEACQRIVRALWQLFTSQDASLIEINPLVATPDGRLLALDAKVTLDDNALFRHADLAALRDESQEHPLELQAGRIGISYVGLDGTIGCLVNGAGLAMATNDIIKLAGGSPANFLDVGGGANVEQVTKAFSIILADQRVKAVLVNIFGGIMRCDWVAQGLLNATRQLDVQMPIVVRLQGTNVEEGRRLLTQAKRLNLISADELEEAAKKIVELSKSGEPRTPRS
ncbi:MAG: ADP-forming succinate--CoA ligase subunit beta [Candidatus Omnitrophica bacterium]|nr:ADP-forming succinate--CoA ligase subunit beta [Candidatus Omnitrophota bacterium]